MTDQDDFWECDFLKDPVIELKKHERLASKNVQVFKKRFGQYYKKVSFHLNIENWNRHQADCLATIKKLRRDRDITLSKILSEENEKTQMDKECSGLRQNIVEKQSEAVDLTEDLKKMVDEGFYLNQDAMYKQTEMRNKYNAMTMAKSWYKSLLKSHVSFEGEHGEGAVFVVTLDNDKHSNSHSVKLLYEGEKSWKLLEVSPQVSNLNLLSNKLQKSQDIVGLLAHLRSLNQLRKASFQSVKLL